MDSQLYVWARKQEIQHELTRRALVSETKALRARDNGGRRGIMFWTKRNPTVTAPTEREETQRAPATSQPAVDVQQNANGRTWRWQVEPGMEDAFQDLLGWMLTSQRGAEVETTASPPPPSAAVAAEQLPEPRPTASRAGERWPASELKPLAA